MKLFITFDKNKCHQTATILQLESFCLSVCSRYLSVWDLGRESGPREQMHSWGRGPALRPQMQPGSLVPDCTALKHLQDPCFSMSEQSITAFLVYWPCVRGHGDGDHRDSSNVQLTHQAGSRTLWAHVECVQSLSNHKQHRHQENTNHRKYHIYFFSPS